MAGDRLLGFLMFRRREVLMKKRNVLLLVAALLGSAYLIYLVSYIAAAPVSMGNSAADAGTAIAMMMIMPHAALTGLAVIFNWIGWGLNKRWAALTAGILYAVAIVMMFMYFMFVVVEMILCFVAFAQMGKKSSVDSGTQA